MRLDDAARGPLAAVPAEATTAPAARGLSPLTRQLHEEGYCCIPQFLTVDEVEALRSETRQYPEQLKAYTASDGYGVDWDGPGRIRQIYHAEVLNPLLNAIVRSERTLGVLRQVYGYDIGLHHAKFILKDAGGSAVPWHQDFTYWSQQSDHPCQINCMVYLDDADDENGCLQVVPGSHVRGLRAHASSADQTFYAGLSEVDPTAVRSVPGRAGTAILFGPLLVHASGPNRSTRPRHSFTAVYTNPFLDAHREVLSCFFPQERIKALSGPGPFGFCAAHYQLRNLWQLAADHVANSEWAWIEITDRTFNDGSFEWLSARKHPLCSYLRFEQTPHAHSNRDDVVVRPGLLADTLRGLTGPFGLVLLDCERTAHARQALHALAPGLREGTVVVLDHFYNYPGWQWGPYRVFQDFVLDRGLGFDYLGRSPRQVAIRLSAGTPAGCPAMTWEPVSQGIVYE